MNTSILDQINNFATCSKQEIMMREASKMHDIKAFIKPDNGHSFEFKTNNSVDSPYRYVFKRRLHKLNRLESKILITADFLDDELKEYEKRKENLHDYLVFMYSNIMLEFDMRYIRWWIMKEGPNPKEIIVRDPDTNTNKKNLVYYIPMSIPHIIHDYSTTIATRDSIFNKWEKGQDANQTKQLKQPTQQTASISPYF